MYVRKNQTAINEKKITPPFEAAGSMCLLSDQYFA